MTQQSRLLGAVVVLLSLSIALSACGAAPVAQNWPGLTIDGDTIYVISGAPQKVYLLDAETGNMKLSFEPQGERKGIVYWSPVTVGGDLAFVGFAEPQNKVHGLYAFDPETGQEQWHVAVEDLIMAAPTYDEGMVYFGSSDGRVYAVDVEAKGVKSGWPFEAEEAIWASPLIADGRVYVASMDHHVYCLDADSGDEIWKHEVGGALAAQPTLGVSNGVLYVGSFDGHVYALKADSGEPDESFEFQAENWIWSKVLVGDDQLWVTSLDGQLYALDPSSGTRIAPYPYNSGEAGDENDRIRTDAVLAGEKVIVATAAGRIIAVQDAARSWVWPGGAPENQIMTTPVLSDGTLYVATMTGEVQALDAETGTQGWTFSPPGAD